MLFLDNLSGVKEDLVLDREALIVPASGSASVTAEITLSDTQKTELDTCFENGIYVEGYTYLDSLNEDGIGMSLPFMGFYGDWSAAPILTRRIIIIPQRAESTHTELMCGHRSRFWA